MLKCEWTPNQKYEEKAFLTHKWAKTTLYRKMTLCGAGAINFEENRRD